MQIERLRTNRERANNPACLPSDFRLSKVREVDSDDLMARDDCGREGGSTLPVSPVALLSPSLKIFLTFFVIFDLKAFIVSFD